MAPKRRKPINRQKGGGSMDTEQFATKFEFIKWYISTTLVLVGTLVALHLF
ncbi:hypothetical protein [Lactiplantibacillus daowaiensis]|uniref:Uncharacterized protein n=1 Tax=Lactiplantibacillus daowaiensis TaxID=2559918 RepID=A0ABW1S0F3_9LACO|nr:hypothetical protein [Lactiplantibacillus daowaiensis]